MRWNQSNGGFSTIPWDWDFCALGVGFDTHIWSNRWGPRILLWHRSQDSHATEHVVRLIYRAPMAMLLDGLGFGGQDKGLGKCNRLR